MVFVHCLRCHFVANVLRFSRDLQEKEDFGFGIGSECAFFVNLIGWNGSAFLRCELQFPPDWGDFAISSAEMQIYLGDFGQVENDFPAECSYLVENLRFCGRGK